MQYFSNQKNGLNLARFGLGCMRMSSSNNPDDATALSRKSADEYDVEKDEYTCPNGKKFHATYVGKRVSK